MLTDEGTTMVKVFLHISKDEQRARLQARIDDPAKNWKFRRSDLEVRAQWDEYQDRYEEAITETSTDWAPWYVVPADRKWVRDVAVADAAGRRCSRGSTPRFPTRNPASRASSSSSRRESRSRLVRAAIHRPKWSLDGRRVP